jgi:hypothetical protein
MHPTKHQPVPLPRVVNRPPTQEDLVPRVPTGPTEADCCVRLVGDTMQIIESRTPQQENHEPPTARPPTQIVGSRIQLTKDATPLHGYHEPPSARPNYITQDESDEPRRGYNTRSRTTSIMQEAMLACIDITKPQFKISPANLAVQKFPMTWLCKMANSVINKKGKLLEYRHLIANPKMRPRWTHSYGNELGQLAQGMPGRAKGTDTIFFIPQHKVPKERTKDITHGLITCSIRPEKVDQPNRTRLVTGGDRVHYPFDVGTPTANLLTVKLLINSVISTPGAKFFTMDIKNFIYAPPWLGMNT